MTDPKEKSKPLIKTRAPGRLGGGGMFDRVKLRPDTHPIEEVLSGVAVQLPTTEEVALTPTPVPTPVVTPATTGVSTPATTPVKESPRPSIQYLDATHTASEQRVYSVMFRETISKGASERHFGPKELCERTGIRSDRTVRTAIDGLVLKRSIEIISNYNGSPLGPRYRIFEPKEITVRRREAGIEIDPQSKRIITPVATPVAAPVATGDKTYRGTGVETTGATGVDIAGVTNKYSKDYLSKNLITDDERVPRPLREAERELTGKNNSEPEQWGEVYDVLIAELKIASARTTISSVPAFLAEHLRRRLWKLDRKQARAEDRELPDEKPPALTNEQVKDCPDCGGTGMWYPQGYEKGVAKCKHQGLQPAPGQ